jgi:hypothetical protein
MKKELLAELNGYFEAVKKHNDEYGGISPASSASVTLEGFATYLDTGKVHELDKKGLNKIVKAEEKAATEASK